MYGGDEINSLVFDMGIFNGKFGYSGEDSPKYVFQSQVGFNNDQLTTNSKNTFIGENELRFFKPNTKVYPIFNNQGLIENQDAFESTIKHVYYNCLKTESKEHPVIFSEPGIHNKENRALLSQIMFEKFEIPAIFVCKTPVLSAFSCGRSTCLVLDSGSQSTWSTAVHDGYVLNKTQLKYDIAGNFVSNELYKLTSERNVKFWPFYKFSKDSSEEGGFKTIYHEDRQADISYENFWIKEIIRDMKESSLSVSEESVQGKEVNIKSSYELPDGNIVELGDEKLSLLECLFKSNKDVPGFQGIHQMVFDVINKGDIEIKRDLFSNIFLTGGNTLFPNLAERLQRQLNLNSYNLKVKVLTHPSPSERRFSAWIGGSILSSLGTFHQIWFSKQEYEEHGAVLIERKCA